jgi:hypothetical protein
VINQIVYFFFYYKGISDKIEPAEKTELVGLIDESLDWLEENPEADAEVRKLNFLSVIFYVFDT